MIKIQSELMRIGITWVTLVFCVLLVFGVTDLDIVVLSWFYNQGQCWCLADHGAWKGLYVYGIFIAYIPVLIAMVVFVLSFWFPARFTVWRKAAVYVICCMILGPGLIVNVILKDQWGRARPREVKELGGAEVYAHPWQYGSTPGGKSFPCGHCSMGFMVSILFLVFKNRNRLIAYALLAIGLIFGLLIGWARMLAGGHFLSDVLWSGIVVWAVGLIMYKLLQMDKPWQYAPTSSNANKKKATWVTMAVGMAFALFTVGLMVATPYISTKGMLKSTSVLKKDQIRTVALYIPEGTVTLRSDTALKIDYAVYAFGFPNSKIGLHNEQRSDTAYYEFRKSGYFTEVRNTIQVGIPLDTTLKFIIYQYKGKIRLENPMLGQYVHVMKNNQVLIEPLSK